MKTLTWGRRRKNKNFYNENVKFTTKSYRSFEELKTDPPVADYYLVGSDQVWNSQITGGHLDPAFFLDFVQSTKKISYASSIGTTNVELSEVQMISNYLDEFSCVYVREESARKLLENTGLKDVKTVLDPVFLLNSKEYEKFLKPAISKKYLLLYVFERSDIVQELADKLAAKFGLQIVEIGTFRPKFTSDKYFQNLGVEEFLSLVYYSDFIITSSFHGLAFSLIFNKQFAALSPKIRKTRLENLVNIAGLEQRLISGGDIDLSSLENQIDYGEVNNRLRPEIEKSRDLLNKALSK